MIVLQGFMLAPPERGTIIGRASWKTRYIVLQDDVMMHSEKTRRGLKSSSKPSLLDLTKSTTIEKQLFLSVYKSKGDNESLAQYPISTFKTCEVRNVQHRKQAPSLPTLYLQLKPDSLFEKQRKRRSARPGGLAPKDPWSNAVLFRTIEGERLNIYDWEIQIKPFLTATEEAESAFNSPLSPTFSFTNPFANLSAPGGGGGGGGLKNPSRVSHYQHHQYQRHQNQLQQQQQQQHVSRPPALISPSPSLRSRRSDVSSRASSQLLQGSGSQPYPTSLEADLPSPVSINGYETKFIEGWTSAQGRSSALSFHTRASNSIASAITTSVLSNSTPPGPRETILDRAFQMRCIPGSERVTPTEDIEKLSSIARFEALMRDHDNRKAQLLAANLEQVKEARDPVEDTKVKIEESEEDSEDDLYLSDHDTMLPTPAQRALEFISGRYTPICGPLSPPPRSAPPLFLNTQAMSALHGSQITGGLRSQAGTSSSRKNNGRSASIAVAPRSASSTTISKLKDYTTNNLTVDGTERRRSSTSVKRLSFQEFARRLSSNSSLLLVQTNASTSSRGGSHDQSSEETISGRSLGSRDERDKRCGWRGSVGGAFGVSLGGEGGFL